MERNALIYNNGQLAGVLQESSKGYRFTYDPTYLASYSAPAISLTLPKQEEPFYSPMLFPFFYGLLSEGINKEVQCRTLKIDEKDHFGRLLKTAATDTIGAITIKPVNNEE